MGFPPPKFKVVVRHEKSHTVPVKPLRAYKATGSYYRGIPCCVFVISVAKTRKKVKTSSEDHHWVFCFLCPCACRDENNAEANIFLPALCYFGVVPANRVLRVFPTSTKYSPESRLDDGCSGKINNVG